MEPFENFKLKPHLIAQRFRIEAVHIHTSTASHIEHNNSPKIQISKISQVAEKGRTASPTRRSATARETIKRLVTVLSLVLIKTATMTKQFPTITATFINAKL